DMANDFQEKQLNHEAAVNSIVFSPDGRWLASLSQDRTARLWDVATGQTLAVMGLDGAGAQLSFNQDGSHLVTTTESGPWQVWDLKSVDIPHQKFEHEQVVEAAVLSNNGALVFSGGRDFDTHVWERATGAETTLSDQSQLITDVAITAEDNLVATASEDGVVIIRDVSTQTVKQTIEVTGVVFALAFNQAGTRLTTVDSFGNVITWEIASGDELFRSNHSNFPDLLAVAYDPQGNSLATGGADGSVVVWDAAAGSTSATLTHGSQPITAITYTADGQWLLTASQDGLVRLWEVAQLGRFNFQNNPETQTLTHPDAVNDLAADPQGKWVATAGADGFLRLWELSTWAEVARVPHSGPVQSVAFSGNGTEIVTTSGAAALVWQVDDLPLLRSSDLVTAACQRVTRDLTDAERQTYITAEGARNRVTCP
ncbi:MAG: WD40 repeat domain-containing protein, partial [Anaerolineales bacterium]|nr:WD40 repeat domain-containing protein [Anaerolineales bacterium]